MEKTKTIEAWAVFDEEGGELHGKLLGTANGQARIFRNIDLAKSNCFELADEVIRPVMIIWKVE